MATQKIALSIEMPGMRIPGTQVTLGSLFSGTDIPSVQNRDVRVHVISQAGVPRWVLPEMPRRAVRVLASWRPYRLSSRLKWSGIIAACRANLLPAIPGIGQEMLTFSTSYWSHNLPGFSSSWEIVAYIGNPFPTRKALLFFVDDLARVQAVVKVPIYPAAKKAILNEAKILASLRGQIPLPEILFCDEQEGIAAQSWLEGSNVPRKFGREHMELLSSFASQRERVRLSDCRESLERRIASLGPEVDSSILRKTLSLLEIHDDLPVCIEHGDFVPWNLRRTRDGQLTLIDWEWATEAGFPWQDVCRYFYLQDYLFQESADVWRILTTNPLLAEYQRRLGLSTQAMRGLTASFLLRYFCDEYQEGNCDRVEYAIRKLRELLT